MYDLIIDTVESFNKKLDKFNNENKKQLHLIDKSNKFIIHDLFIDSDKPDNPNLSDDIIKLIKDNKQINTFMIKLQNNIIIIIHIDKHNKFINFIGSDIYFESIKSYLNPLIDKYQYKMNYINLNPPLVIISATDNKSGKQFNVIDDSVLEAGTKQRALAELLVNIHNDYYDKYGTMVEFCYVGPSNAVGQYALAYVASLLGYKVKLFLVGKPTEISKKSKLAKANIKYLNANMAIAEEIGKQWENENKKSRKLIEFGLDFPGYKDKLVESIKSAWDNRDNKDNIKDDPKRMFVPCGSTVLINTLYKVFPNTKFFAVRVGKSIWPDQLDMTRTTIIDYIKETNITFAKDARIMPPYKSIPTYDAKVWEMAIKYGESGDYIWNVSGI